MSAIMRKGQKYCETLFSGPASQIAFTPGNSGMSSTNAQAAILEAYNASSNSAINKSNDTTTNIQAIDVVAHPSTGDMCLRITYLNSSSVRCVGYIDFK